jgi:hypothetical protein
METNNAFSFYRAKHCPRIRKISQDPIRSSVSQKKVFMLNTIKSQLLNNLQNQYQDAQNILPVLLAIVEDLEILEQAFIFNGRFCPLIEHRCPNLLLDDDNIVSNMSYAQRSNQFYMIGRRIVKNCRTIIYLTPVNHLPQITKTCKNLIAFLLDTKQGSNTSYLQIDTSRLMSNPSDDFNQMIFGLRKYHKELDDIIPTELPNLAYKSLCTLIFNILLIIYVAKSTLELLQALINKVS